MERRGQAACHHKVKKKKERDGSSLGNHGLWLILRILVLDSIFRWCCGRKELVWLLCIHQKISRKKWPLWSSCATQKTLTDCNQKDHSLK